MGSLEYVSPQATFATAFVTRDPRQLLTELLAAAGPTATDVVMNTSSKTPASAPG
jgi:hypothetical protein